MPAYSPSAPLDPHAVATPSTPAPLPAPRGKPPAAADLDGRQEVPARSDTCCGACGGV